MDWNSTYFLLILSSEIRLGLYPGPGPIQFLIIIELYVYALTYQNGIDQSDMDQLATKYRLFPKGGMIYPYYR